MSTKTVPFLFLTCLILFTSCTSTKVSTGDSIPTNKILFLAYELKKDSNNIDCSLIQQIVADGTLNEEKASEKAVANDLSILFYNKEDKLVHQQVIKNPFVQHIEGIGESNTLERKEVEQSRAEVTLRTNLLAGMQKIVLQYSDKNGNKKTIYQHNLNQ